MAIIAYPRYCGVVLSAGASTRMGRTKALLPWPPDNQEGSTLLSSAITALKTTANSVVVVVGKNRDEIAPVTAAYDANLIVNPDPDRGHFSSMQVGLREMARLGYNTAIITPVDRPPLSAENLRKLCDSFSNSAANIWALIPTHGGRNGHPLIAGPQLVEALLRAPVESNAHEVMTACADHITHVEVDDPTVTLNVNTPEDYEQLTTLLKRK